MVHLWSRFCGLKGEKSTHSSPSQPRRGVVGPNIDRCITVHHNIIKVYTELESLTLRVSFSFLSSVISFSSEATLPSSSKLTFVLVVPDPDCDCAALVVICSVVPTCFPLGSWYSSIICSHAWYITCITSIEKYNLNFSS